MAAAARKTNKTYSAGFSCAVTSYLVFCALWCVALILQVFLVHIPLAFPDNVVFGTANLPYLNRPGADPLFDADGALLYSFESYVFASDLLLFLVPLAMIGSMLFGIVWGLRSITATGAPIFAGVVALLQLAKSAYFTLYFFSLFGFECVQFAYCQHRNIAVSASNQDTLFKYELWFTYVNTAGSLFMLSLPSVYRALQGRAIRMGANYAAAASSAKYDVSVSLETVGKEYAREKKRTKRRNASKHPDVAEDAGQTFAEPVCDEADESILPPRATFHSNADVSW